MLYNANIAALLLGCIFKNPSLIVNNSYPMNKLDFSPIPMHRVLFVCADAIAKTGCNEISEIEIDNFVSKYEAQKEILEDGNYFEFIDTVKELATLENFDYYYTIVRKFSLLRELKEQGVNITPYYDESQEEYEAQQNLEKWSIQDILADVESKTNKLRNKYDIHYVRDEIKAGDNPQDFIDMFKARPSFGALLQSGYLSTLYNGWNRGHLILRAGNSGSGKTRSSVADLCSVGALEVWNEDYQDFISNKNYQSPTLFIATEQDVETEVQPMFYSAISGVEYRKLVDGRLTQEEELRVLKAGEIIGKSNLTITSMPRFTKQSLERKIKEKVETEGIQYCCFDYMEVQGDLSAEFKKSNAVTPRQDLILLDLASHLKMVAEDYNVGILTGSQLNDSWKDMRYIDEGALSGSKAMKFKLDAGSIVVPTSYLKKDMKILEPLFNRKRSGFGGDRIPYPNVCEFIFKSRYGTFGDQRLKMWSYFDKGTFRRFDYFVTDDENNPIKVPISKIEEDDF